MYNLLNKVTLMFMLSGATAARLIRSEGCVLKSRQGQNVYSFQLIPWEQVLLWYRLLQELIKHICLYLNTKLLIYVLFAK